MAIISETELQRRLRALEKQSGASTSYVGTTDPTGSGFSAGNSWYNTTTNNLWLFDGTRWDPSFSDLNLRYADNVVNLDDSNMVSSQLDVTGFSEYPFSVDGVEKAWRGIFFGPPSGSSDPTDYEWTLLADTEYDLTFDRYYTEDPGILTEIGDPDNPGTDVTWVEATSGISNNAYWIAERYTKDGFTSSWKVFPVQAKPSGVPFVKYERLGVNQPVLGSEEWIEDAILAVSAFTGKVYTNQKEFGYSTVVVIDYADGTLSGRYTQIGGVDTWVAPGEFIAGDLIVDGTIAGDKIQANAITATKIDVDDLSAISANLGTIQVDTANIANAAITNAKIENAAISNAKIGNLEVDTIKIANNAITAIDFRQQGTSDLTLNFNIPDSTGGSYEVFFIASLVQSYFSTISFSVDGAIRWQEIPRDGTLATRGWSQSLSANTNHSIRIWSSDSRNSNNSSIIAFARKK